MLDAALGQPAAPDVTAELTRRLREHHGVFHPGQLYADLSGRQWSADQRKRVNADLHKHRVLARNPAGRGYVRGNFDQ